MIVLRPHQVSDRSEPWAGRRSALGDRSRTRRVGRARLSAMGALEQTTSKADSLRIFAAAGTSLLGDGVRNAALPLLAVALSPTPAAVGIVTFAGTVPILLFTLLGGALADRHDRRALMWRTDLLRGVLVGAFAIWVLVATPPLWTLIITTFLLGSAGTVFDSASNSFIVDFFGPDPTRPATAN